ncbi:MAG: N-(5'-phosphoribosyl)anthranilate isomerase [Acidobacteria bacterium]|nr:MAG: N-(5'-phosphoribosyl)anthranilate isomerase [Acidobacteriota bacterium]
MMVKICGITNLDDALAAIDAGAAALGFNFWPGSPRHIALENARHIIRQLPPAVLKVGVFVDEPREKVNEMSHTAGLDVAQLHGREAPGDFPDGVRVWKAVRVALDFNASDVDQYPGEAVLLDGPSNGVPFDWTIAAHSSKRIIIAGGLDANNVRNAMDQARPWGVDACSRLETAPGKKDRLKMTQFIKAALAEDR